MLNFKPLLSRIPKRAFCLLLAACILGNCLSGSSHAQEQVGSQWQLTRTLEVPGRVVRVLVSPNSDVVVALSIRQITLWNPDTGTALGTVFDGGKDSNDSLSGAGFSPDGKTLAVGFESNDTGRLILIDLETKKEIFSQPTQRYAPEAVCYSQDGQFIAYSYYQKQGSVIEILDTATNKVIRQLKGMRYTAEALAWQADDEALLSAGGGVERSDGGFGDLQCEYIRWDAEAGKIGGQHFLKPGSSNAVFNKNGTLLATMGGEFNIEKTASGNQRPAWRGKSIAAYSIPRSDEAPALLTQLTDEKLYLRTNPRTSGLMDWSPDSKLLGFSQGGDTDGNLIIWDGFGETSVSPRIAAGGELTNSGRYLGNIDFFPSGDRLAAVSNSKLQIWSRKNANAQN